MIRDKIVFSSPRGLREQMLRENDLTLEKAVYICRAVEVSQRHAKEMTSEVEDASVKKLCSQCNHNLPEKEKTPQPIPKAQGMIKKTAISVEQIIHADNVLHGEQPVDSARRKIIIR